MQNEHSALVDVDESKQSRPSFAIGVTSSKVRRFLHKA